MKASLSPQSSWPSDLFFFINLENDLGCDTRENLETELLIFGSGSVLRKLPAATVMALRDNFDIVVESAATKWAV